MVYFNKIKSNLGASHAHGDPLSLWIIGLILVIVVTSTTLIILAFAYNVIKCCKFVHYYASDELAWCACATRSVGCIIYELAALRHAFEGKTLMGVMYQIVEVAAPNWPEGYSDELANLYYAYVFCSNIYFYLYPFVGWGTVLIHVCLFVCLLAGWLKKLQVDFYEVCGIGRLWTWTREELSKVGSD